MTHREEGLGEDWEGGKEEMEGGDGGREEREGGRDGGGREGGRGRGGEGGRHTRFSKYSCRVSTTAGCSENAELISISNILCRSNGDVWVESLLPPRPPRSDERVGVYCPASSSSHSPTRVWLTPPPPWFRNWMQRSLRSDSTRSKSSNRRDSVDESALLSAAAVKSRVWSSKRRDSLRMRGCRVSEVETCITTRVLYIHTHTSTLN